MSRIARSLVALLVLLAALIGAPIALWRMGRGFLPDHMPNFGEIWTAATSTDTGNVFLGFLVIVGVIAWAVFALCVLLEVGSLLTGRRRTGRPGRVQAAPRIKGLRAPQTAVSALISLAITGTLMLGSAAMASASTPSLAAVNAVPAVSQSAAASGHAATSNAPRAPASASTSHTAARPTAGPTWIVSRYDSLWSIAERTMGDGTQYNQIAKLNIGVQQPDGRSMKTADTPLEVGWKVLLPSTAVLPADHTAGPPVGQKSVKVREGDSLSRIAQAQYGDGDRWPELAAANHLADPDELTPGQVLLIPGVAGDPTPAAPTGSHPAHTAPPATEPATRTPTATPAPAASKPPAHHSTPRAGSPAPAAAPARPTTPVGQNQQHQPSTQPAPAAEAAPTTPKTAPTTQGTSATATAAPAESSNFTELVAGIGAALGAVLLAGIAVARRRKGRRRPAGEVPRPVSLSATRVERHLRERASGADVAWMDNALRSAAALSADRPVDQMPDVTALWLSPQELQLQLTAPVPAPPPFLEEADSWVIPTGTELPDRTETAAPFPALVSLGESADETFLVDLERIGALTISGDAQRTANLLRHIAVEYGHSLWSDHLQVYLVGWGENVTALRPDRLSYAPSVADVLPILRGRLAEALEVQAEGGTTVLESRIADQHTVDDPWTPTILLIDARPDEDLQPLTQALQRITGAGRSAVAVVTRTDQLVVGSAKAHIAADGTLQLPTVLSNDLRVQAAGLTEPALDELLELFAAAGQFQKPNTVSDTTQPWSTDMSVMGSLLAPAPATTTPATKHSAEQSSAAAPPVAEARVDDDLDLTSHHEVDEDEVDPSESIADSNADGQVVALRPTSEATQQVLAKVLADDPTLDADVDEWFSVPPNTEPDADKDWVLRPRVGVLGTPQVLARGTRPADRINRFTEMAVYLAVHREVEVDMFAADLWPTGETPSGDNRRSYVSKLRSWMGTDPEGRKYLPAARLKPYRLERLLDIELFRRLRKRADAHLQAEDHTRAMADLCSALDLVRGPVLHQHPRNGYSWSSNTETDLKDANLMMLETAHLLVDLALEAGDLRLARQAADVAYSVDSKADTPLVDHMRIAHQVGDDQKARGWLAALLQANEIELAEDLPNFDTFQAVTEVFPDGLPAAANS